MVVHNIFKIQADIKHAPFEIKFNNMIMKFLIPLSRKLLKTIQSPFKQPHFIPDL